MPPERLSALDASFLDIETPSAHMHLGWAATLDRPADRLVGFEQLRSRIESRLGRAPRFRQRLAHVPLGLGEPVWVDDHEFELSRHVIHDTSQQLADVVERAMSCRLERDRPLWEIWIADRLADGRIGVVGKMHHCMVDGIAAVELASLLFDTDDETTDGGWHAEPPPTGRELVLASAATTARDAAGLARSWLGTVTSPTRMLRLGTDAVRGASVVARTLVPAPPARITGDRLSPDRRLATVARDVSELRRVRTRFDCTLNDVLLAAVTGGLRRFLGHFGDPPESVRALVPVNVRAEEGDPMVGNRISFMLVDLPCEEPDPARRIRRVEEEASRRKGSGEARAADALMKALGLAPRPLRRAAARAVASPRTFNVSVSNVPGPIDVELTLAGCPLREAYPIVPLADGHYVSIGMTTVGDQACFGLYADPNAVDADLLAEDVAAAVDELVALAIVDEAVEVIEQPVAVEVDSDTRLREANVELSAREHWLAWLENELLGAPLSEPESELNGFRLCETCARRFGVSDDGTDDPVQYGLGSSPSPRLAARFNRERALGGDTPLCTHRVKARM